MTDSRPTRLESYSLSEGQVHVWSANLDHFPSEEFDPFEILSNEEKESASRLRFELDRRRHVLGLAMVRTLVGRLLGVAADRLQIRRERSGKPSVAPETNVRGVGFNISHSGGLVVVALGVRRSIGIDVERISVGFQFESLVPQVLSTVERAELEALPQFDRLQAFFRVWCRKEALAKAKGTGLACPFDRIDVSPISATSLIRLDMLRGTVEPRRWEIRDIEVGSSYSAALAVEGTGFELRSFRFLGGTYIESIRKSD